MGGGSKNASVLVDVMCLHGSAHLQTVFCLAQTVFRSLHNGGYGKPANAGFLGLRKLAQVDGVDPCHSAIPFGLHCKKSACHSKDRQQPAACTGKQPGRLRLQYTPVTRGMPLQQLLDINVQTCKPLFQSALHFDRPQLKNWAQLHARSCCFSVSLQCLCVHVSAPSDLG